MKLERLNHIVVVIAALFLAKEAGAVTMSYNGSTGLELSWQADETVGVTSGNVTDDIMQQLTYWASSTASASRNDRNLYAVGYKLKEYMTYYSYYPYQWAESFDAHNIVCRYDAQSQNGNGSTAALSSCDYSMATATTSAVACTFSYQHIGGILRISFLAPRAMDITSLILRAQAPALATTAVMDIMAQKVTLDGYSATLTMATQNISVAASQQVVLYVALPAQDLSSTALDIIVSDSAAGDVLIARVLGPNVKPGKLYDVQVENVEWKMESKVCALSGAPEASGKSGEYALYTVPSLPSATATGIANPVAHAADILFDRDYTVQYVQQAKKGDVNGDGDMDVLDAIAIVGYYTKGRAAELDPAICDMNGDGDIDVLDAIEIVGRYTKAQK